ncbi:MAG TPA: hypothetical protein PLW37_02120 [bacterium]|jgi:hypothetical protein|nr:hypothetical protein [bacterium]HOB72584.1 hypothetical protein [bacterium]HPG35300.1 hypothetical protein [bacterium]HPV20672.1 hypothetical protein [bacterium]HPY14806.1 hypothetical protein [bacterium]
MIKLLFLILAITTLYSCGDNDNDIEWSERSNTKLNLSDAYDYCNGLGGRIPSISELRELVVNCAPTETKGECGIKDECSLSESCLNNTCSGCEESSLGIYSSFKDIGPYWSSSFFQNSNVWTILKESILMMLL